MTDEELLAFATDTADQTLNLCKSISWSSLKGLESQLQRAAVSVPSNIAEGLGRDVLKDPSGKCKGKIRFFLIAYGSLRECLVQLELLRRQRSDRALEVTGLMQIWANVRSSLLTAVDGSPPAEPELIYRAPGAQALPWIVRLRPVFDEFLTTIKGIFEFSSLGDFPMMDRGDTLFTLEALHRFLRVRGINMSQMEITKALRIYGWNSVARRFGKKIIRVWVAAATTRGIGG